MASLNRALNRSKNRFSVMSQKNSAYRDITSSASPVIHVSDLGNEDLIIFSNVRGLLLSFLGILGWLSHLWAKIFAKLLELDETCIQLKWRSLRIQSMSHTLSTCLNATECFPLLKSFVFTHLFQKCFGRAVMRMK